MRLIDADALFDFLTDQLKEEVGFYSKGRNTGLNVARSALHDKTITPTISPPPNDPLTLEELREMDGEPVWVDDIVFRRDRSCGGLWAIVVLAYDEIVFGDRDSMPLKDVVGFAYRRKPEEGTK